ncbi:MAG: hypothetical protein ACI809_000849 [Candidatus Azotimanducaceae bacterium]|jgi:hypothetical protein
MTAHWKVALGLKVLEGGGTRSAHTEIKGTSRLTLRLDLKASITPFSLVTAAAMSHANGERAY